MPSTSQAQVGLQTDLNHDSTVNISDVSYLISLLMGRATDDAVAAGICPNAMHPHVIDLGLPSGTKWTCCNIGAKNPLEYGEYYAWGEMLTKDSYNVSNYFYYVNGAFLDLGEDIAGTMCDIATVKWGNDYTMPSYDQFNELVDNCEFNFTSVRGVSGGLFTADNRNMIFMPAAGVKTTRFSGSGTNGYCFSSSIYSDDERAYGFGWNASGTLISSSPKAFGLSVRPVAQ